jgi:hypothetical protein
MADVHQTHQRPKLQVAVEIAVISTAICAVAGALVEVVQWLSSG